MTVQFFGYVIDKANGSTTFEPKSCSDIRELIDDLGECFGQSFKEFLLGKETCLFLVNGSGVLMTGGFNTRLKQGDRIEILPFVGAG